MSIYTRDNLASSLSQQLEAALNRRQKYVENDAARRDANVKAINGLVKSIAYAQEDELDDKRKKLMAERNAALKAQEIANKAVLDANERSLNAEQQMDGYRPAADVSEYERIMQGYRPSMPTRQPIVTQGNPDFMYKDPEKPQPGYNYWDAMQGFYRRGIY